MFWLPAAIGAGASLIGNVFSSASNRRTNNTNMQIAQMNNQWSEKMMQKQMDYNTDMWNKTNEYNSASSQRQRLEDAGLNPSLMMNGGSAGVAQGASSPSLPSPSQAVMQPNRYDFSGIGEAVQNAYIARGQVENMDANTRFLNTQSDWYSAKAMAELAESFQRSNNWFLQNKGLEIQNNWADKMLGQDYINKIRTNQSLEQSILNSVRQGLLLDKDLAWYDAKANGDLSEQLSRISLNYANGSLSLQQTEKALAETLNLIEQRIGMKMDNDIKANLRDSTIERGKQAQNMYQWTDDVGKRLHSDIQRYKNTASDWFNKNIIKPSKKAWKNTRRSFGLYYK